eukprot:COSAG01_NODE_7297_length_3262_cov_8.165033_3_plen_92_part_00
MAMGAAYASKDRAGFNSTELGAAIGSYDAAWAAYRAFGLAEVYAASLYHPYYLCLGARQHPSLLPNRGASICSQADQTMRRRGRDSLQLRV